MQKLQRNIAMTFRVTEEEREMIRRRQEQTGIQNLRACIRITDPTDDITPAHNSRQEQGA